MLKVPFQTPYYGKRRLQNALKSYIKTPQFKFNYEVDYSLQFSSRIIQSWDRGKVRQDEVGDNGTQTYRLCRRRTVLKSHEETKPYNLLFTLNIQLRCKYLFLRATHQHANDAAEGRGERRERARLDHHKYDPVANHAANGRIKPLNETTNRSNNYLYGQ